jgi:lipopolysaccharide transport system ATP-binding protein
MVETNSPVDSPMLVVESSKLNEVESSRLKVQSSTSNLQPVTDIAISVRNVSKMYPLYAQPSDRLKQSLWYALPGFLRGQPRQFYQEFWALRDISFEVKRGEALGIIGQNGSGKSTLLQIIAGTLTPTHGEVRVNGRVAALLELGSGFNPEFTGRDNVFMNGAILGIPQEEMKERFETITRFAQIGDFIDQPVKTYSSGMYIRLAFAVAVCVDPDILIVDEALSVGDAIYQSRSYRRMEEMRKAGKTIILVTHDFYTVQSFCDRAILLDLGQILKIGEAKPVVNRYIELIATREREYVEWLAGQIKKHTLSIIQHDTKPTTTQIKDNEQETIQEEFRFGTGEVKIIDYYLLNEKGEKIIVWERGKVGTIVVVTRFFQTIERPIIGFVVNTPTGINVFGDNSWYANNEPGPQQAGTILNTEFRQPILLNPGNYVISFAIADKKPDRVAHLDNRMDVMSFTVTGPRETSGIVHMGTEIIYTVIPNPTSDSPI